MAARPSGDAPGRDPARLGTGARARRGGLALALRSARSRGEPEVAGQRARGGRRPHAARSRGRIPGPRAGRPSEKEDRAGRGALPGVGDLAAGRRPGARARRGACERSLVVAGAARGGRDLRPSAAPARPARAGSGRAAGRAEAARRVRSRPAARGPLAAAGFLRNVAWPVDLQGPASADAPPARAERPRPAGHPGPSRLLGAPLSGHPPRADAQIPEARLARKRGDRVAALSESPALRAIRAPVALPRAAALPAGLRNPRFPGRGGRTARRDPSPRRTGGRRTAAARRRGARRRGGAAAPRSGFRSARKRSTDPAAAPARAGAPAPAVLAHTGRPDRGPAEA